MTSEATEKKELQLTEYEAGRLKELTTALVQGEDGLRQLGALVRELAESLREVRGRRAELLQTLGNKYEFDPNTPFNLGEDGKLIFSVENSEVKSNE